MRRDYKVIGNVLFARSTISLSSLCEQSIQTNNRFEFVIWTNYTESNYNSFKDTNLIRVDQTNSNWLKGSQVQMTHSDWFTE